MKSLFLPLFLILFSGVFAQNKNYNKNLLPEPIYSYEGKPALEYLYNGKPIVYDHWIDSDENGCYIEMRLNNREEFLKMEKKNTTKMMRVYSNKNYNVTILIKSIKEPEPDDEYYKLKGYIIIQNTNKERALVSFSGIDWFKDPRKCN